VCEASRRRTPLQGCGPSSACRIGERHTPGLHWPGYAAPSGFRTLLTLCSPRNLSALFQTVTLLGFDPSKVSPSAAWIQPLDQPYPPGVGSNGPIALLADGVLARLPGFTLCGSPLPPSLQAAGVARASLGFPSPPGVFLSLRRPRSSRAPPPMDFDQAGGEPPTVSGPPEYWSKRA